MKPVMTVEEARDILGDEASQLSDREMEELIDDMSAMAGWALEESVKKVLQERGQSNNLSIN